MLENPDILFRFDVVEVIVAEDAEPPVELIKNTFPLSKPYLSLKLRQASLPDPWCGILLRSG